MHNPENIFRLEAATGTNTNTILINDNYLLIENCSFFPKQEIDVEFLIQGGPNTSVMNIGKKYIDGEFSFPLRVDKEGLYEPAFVELLDYASNPRAGLKITANHLLYHMDLTSENGGDTNNKFVNFDEIMIRSLNISSSEFSEVKVSVSVIGTQSLDENAPVIPEYPQLFNISRILNFKDCLIKRNRSNMRLTNSFSFSIENDIQMKNTIVPYSNGVRREDPYLIGNAGKKSKGAYEEIVRLGIDKHNYIHGGYSSQENIKMLFGKLQITLDNVLFTVGEQPLSAGVLKRKTEFYWIRRPSHTGSDFSFI